jgi:hypothetical protein
VKILALDIPERETIVRALEDPPPGLEELRSVLLAEHVGASATGSLAKPLLRFGVRSPTPVVVPPRILRFETGSPGERFQWSALSAA